jgi:hypothetical protein
MTRVSRNLSLNQDHDELISKVAKERHMKFSEVHRCLIDFVIDHDGTLGLAVLANREKSLQAELSIVQEARKKLEQEQKAKITDAPNRVFEEVTNSVNGEARTGPKASFIDKQSGLTEEERFLKAAPYVANEDKAVTPELKRKILDQTREHPEWLAKVQEPERSKLEAILRSAPR